MNRKKIKHAFHFIFHFIWMVLLLLIGYGICSVMFYLVSSPPAVVQYLLSAVLGIGLIIIFLVYIERRNGNFHSDFYDELYSALDKIAKGNFNVFIDNEQTQKHHSFSDIASRVNHMAAQLNSMEIMRRDFVSNVSHEIQSPLTSIKGFSALLKNKNLTYDELLSYIEIIEMESQRLSKLSENLLKLSALESGTKALQLKSYSLDRQIKETILSMEPQWDAKKIQFAIDIKPIMIHADEELMSQVWINLFNNCIKFSPVEGEISISIVDTTKSISIIIGDNGIGISPENQKHIFERFYMADKSRKRDFGGNGLGLSIVKKIIDMHGGSIAIESQLNKGTIFTVSVPVNN